MTERTSDPEVDGPVTEPTGRRRRRPLRAAALVTGVVLVLVAVDFGIGALWGLVLPSDEGDSKVFDGAIRIAPATEPIDLDAAGAAELPADPREDTPALADAPWRHQYFQELGRAVTTFWPYVLWKPQPAEGRYINIDADGVRRSYESGARPGDEAPVVDFYGGSTTFGEGQRDGHTIASEIVRLADDARTPIRARNRGVRGWVNWQEMLLFEQVAADPSTRPDLAVFYDGANEILAQNESIRGVPGHGSIDETMSRLGGVAAASPTAEEPTTTWDHLRALARDYRRTSATARAGRWLRSTVTGERAEASPARIGAPGQKSGDEEAIPVIYRRGRSLIQDIAKRNDVEVALFWQPIVKGGWPTYTDGIDQPTIDLSDALAHRDDVFLDAVHTNEEGARIAAEAMWEHLGPLVEDWYEDHG